MAKKSPQSELPLQGALLLETDPFGKGEMVELQVPELESMRPWRGRIMERNAEGVTVRVLTGPLVGREFQVKVPR